MKLSLNKLKRVDKVIYQIEFDNVITREKKEESNDDKENKKELKSKLGNYIDNLNSYHDEQIENNVSFLKYIIDIIIKKYLIRESEIYAYLDNCKGSINLKQMLKHFHKKYKRKVKILESQNKPIKNIFN